MRIIIIYKLHFKHKTFQRDGKHQRGFKPQIHESGLSGSY